MITQLQFNKALEEINQSYQLQNKRLEALEADLRDLKESRKEKPNASKKRPKTS